MTIWVIPTVLVPCFPSQQRLTFGQSDVLQTEMNQSSKKK